MSDRPYFIKQGKVKAVSVETKWTRQPTAQLTAYTLERRKTSKTHINLLDAQCHNQTQVFQPNYFYPILDPIRPWTIIKANI